MVLTIWTYLFRIDADSPSARRLSMKTSKSSSVTFVNALLLDIEPRLRKAMGYRHVLALRAALKRELKIDTTTSKEKVA